MTQYIQFSRTPRSILAAGLGALTLTLAGCAGGYGTNEVSSSGVGQASEVYAGTVTSAREVTIRPDRSIVGAATGAVLGGIAGSEIGQGDKAETAGAIGGAVLGGVAGNEAGKAINTRRGYAYIVRFNDGKTMEIVQGANIYIQPGTQVDVINGADGWRLVPVQYASPPRSR
jgi:outer membrane lipoprotein SlyB